VRPNCPIQTRFRCATGCDCLRLPHTFTRWLMLQKARRQADCSTLRPVVSIQFQILFHSPRRGSCHLSLTVLVHYRSSRVFSVGRRTPQFPTGLACPVVLRILPTTLALRLRGSHPLWQTFPSLLASPKLLLAVLQPRLAYQAVCAAPRSLATTSGIFSFPRGN
jgi:hypothetical protein